MSQATPNAQESFFQEAAEVVSQLAVSERYHLLRLRAPRIAALARPGQFVMVSCTDQERALTDPLLPRPLALLDADPRTGELQLLYFIAGRGTRMLHGLAAEAAMGIQARVGLLGPLGLGFEPVPEAEVHLGVGGGSGVAPLVFFFRRLGLAKGCGHLILGARSAAQLPRPEIVAAGQTVLHEATDDGSAGFKGNAVQALEGLLSRLSATQRMAVYVAGPQRMMEAAARLARDRGLPCRVSLEERMACGVGVCRACVVDGLTPHPRTGLFRRAVCQDGPVFDPCTLAGAWR